MRTVLTVLVLSATVLGCAVAQVDPRLAVQHWLAVAGAALNQSSTTVAALAGGFGFMALPAVLLWTHTPSTHRLEDPDEPLWRRAR